MKHAIRTTLFIMVSMSLAGCAQLGTVDVKWIPPTDVPAKIEVPTVPTAPTTAKPAERDPAVDAQPAAK